MDAEDDATDASMTDEEPMLDRRQLKARSASYVAAGVERLTARDKRFTASSKRQHEPRDDKMVKTNIIEKENVKADVVEGLIRIDSKLSVGVEEKQVEEQGRLVPKPDTESDQTALEETGRSVPKRNVEVSLATIASLKMPDIRAALEARGLATAGPKSTVTARLRSALEAERPLDSKKSRPTACTIILSNFEACPASIEVCFGAAVTFLVASDDHGSAEYHLACEDFFETPILRRGDKDIRIFDRVGSFIIRDTNMPSLRVMVEVGGVEGTSIEEVRRKIRELQWLDEATKRSNEDAARRIDEALEVEARQKEQALLKANEEAAAAQIEMEKKDANLRAENEATRAKAVRESLDRVVSSRPARRKIRRLDNALAHGRAHAGNDIECEDGKFGKLRNLLAEFDQQQLVVQQPADATSNSSSTVQPRRSYFASRIIQSTRAARKAKLNGSDLPSAFDRQPQTPSCIA